VNSFDLREAAEFLAWNRTKVRIAIEEGVALPRSGERLRLQARSVGQDYEIDDCELDTFIARFEAEEPGRHPPVLVRRELRLEAGFCCALCSNRAPLEYHHMIEFSELRHHDPEHMLAVCPTCHHMAGNGAISLPDQREAKRRLQERRARNGSDTGHFLATAEPVRFNWDDLRVVITALHAGIQTASHAGVSQFDLSDVDLEKKNQLNKMGSTYSAAMVDHHEPYFGRVRQFLTDPINDSITRLYHEIVDELRMKIAAERDRFDRFEHILGHFAEAAVSQNPSLRGNRKVLNILLSFMYVNCDVGLKA
jgi:hypothetical protein